MGLAEDLASRRGLRTNSNRIAVARHGDTFRCIATVACVSECQLWPDSTFGRQLKLSARAPQPARSYRARGSIICVFWRVASERLLECHPTSQCAMGQQFMWTSSPCAGLSWSLTPFGEGHRHDDDGSGGGGSASKSDAANTRRGANWTLKRARRQVNKRNNE